MTSKAIVAILALFLSLSVFALVPGNGPVDPDNVTDEELYVIAKWEDGDLLKERKTVSRLHYPIESKAADCTSRGCLNGCTIGYGYNFGAHGAEKIRHDFALAGISLEKIERFIPLANLTGLDALAMCGSTAIAVANFPTLTPEESWALLRVMAHEHKQNTVRRARTEGILHLFNSGQFAIMVALDYQNPVLSSEAKYIWMQLKAGDIPAVLQNIRFHMGTRFAPGLQWRRNWEASYFAWATSRQRASGNYFWPTPPLTTT